MSRPFSGRTLFVSTLLACLSTGSWIFPSLGVAHDNVVVHRKLGEWTVTSTGNALFPPYVSDVREGCYGEDVPATRSLGHFYNPQTDSVPWFGVGGPAWQNAQTQFDAAFDEYAAGNYTGEDAAFFRLGRTLHFIQDMTSPAHTHDDQHGTDPEDFEDWGPDNVNTFDFSAVTPKSVATPSAEAYVKAVSRLVYDMTSYQADIDENTGTQAASEFKSMFPSLHWVDGGLFGDDRWEVDRIGSFDCFGNGVLCNDGWWMIDERLTEDNSGRSGSRRLRGYAYIENTGGSGGQPIPAVFKGVANTTNEPLLHIYGRLLYPEAVAYGAGLLQVFAQGVATPVPPTATITATQTPTTQSSNPTVTPTSTEGSQVPSATPTVTESPTETAVVASPTPTATELPGPLCGPTPRSCSLPTRPKGSKVMLADRSNDNGDSMTWKWSYGQILADQVGNPKSSTDYAVCVYDSILGVPALVMTLPAPANSQCGLFACWSPSKGGYQYKDALGTSAGITSLTITTSPDGVGGKIKLKAKGALVPLPLPVSATQLLSQSSPVHVQLVNSLGNCWEGIFSAPADRNEPGKFKDKSN